MQVESSGTQTATVGTPATLASPSTANTRVLIVDASNLAAGEVLLLQVSGPVLSAGTTRIIQSMSFTGVLASPNIQSPPFVMPQGGTFTLEQTSGTGRSYPWAVITLA